MIVPQALHSTSSIPSPRTAEDVSWPPQAGHSMNSIVPSGSGPRHPAVPRMAATKRRLADADLAAADADEGTSTRRALRRATFVYCGHDPISRRLSHAPSGIILGLVHHAVLTLSGRRDRVILEVIRDLNRRGVHHVRL